MTILCIAIGLVVGTGLGVGGSIIVREHKQAAPNRCKARFIEIKNGYEVVCEADNYNVQTTSNTNIWCWCDDD